MLWRVRRSPQEQLWCSVRARESGPVLAVEDPATPLTAVTEHHSHIGALIERSEHLRSQLQAAGWTAVDVDLDEPD